MGVGHHDVAIGERMQLRDPEQLDAGDFVAFEAPHDLASGIDFQHAVVVATADERIAARQAIGRVHRGAVAPVGGNRFAVQFELVLPNYCPVSRIFPNGAVLFVCHQIGSLGRRAHEPGVAVRVGIVNLQLDLVLHLAVAIHLDDALVAGLGDHGQAVVEALESVDLDLVDVVGCRRGLPLPDCFLFGGHLGECVV